MSTTSLIEFEGRGSWDGAYEMVDCKRALSPSLLPGIDYALNPYGGCEHGCIYCYAPEVVHVDWRDWRVVKVRRNMPYRLSKELQGISGTVGIGTVTDPYQGAEGRFQLTLRCLEVLRSMGFRIHVHTKSDLILRDLDMIAGMRGEVGITITTFDDRYSKATEPGAPDPMRRLRAMEALVDAHVDTYALVGPILSHLEGKEEDFVNRIASTGVRRMQVDSLNGRPGLSGRLDRMGIKGSERSVRLIKGYAAGMGIVVEDVFSRH